MTENLDNWLELFQTHQQVFVAHHLDNAIQYLHKARNLGEGWGAYPGLPSDFHHSSLAIEALYYSCDERSIGIIADAALYLRKAKSNHLEQLNLEELTDLLMVACTEQNPDNDYIEQLLKVLQQAYDTILARKEEFSVRSMCGVLLAVLGSRKSPQKLIQPWIDRLLNLQRTDDGSWPAVAEESGSVIATAFALRVLTHVSKNRGGDPIDRGLQYLQNRLEKEGWQKLGIEGDTFTQAVVLRALAEAQTTQYKQIQDGIDILINRMNLDGGWGGNAGEPSNIECTALCVLALVTSGENRFLPAHLAKAALHDTQHMLIKLTNERNQLRQDFEQKIKLHCGKVVQERDQLQKENKSLKEQLNDKNKEFHGAMEQAKNVQLRFEELQKSRYFVESPYLSLHGRFSKLNLIKVGPILSAGIAVWQLWEWPLSFWKIIAVSLISLITITIEYIVWVRYRRENLQPPFIFKTEEKLSPNLSMLRSMFMKMARDWPPRLLEEVVYRLFRELIYLPPDVGRRYTEDLVYRIGLSQKDTQELKVWVDYVMRLDTRDRRLLFDQLQKVIL